MNDQIQRIERLRSHRQPRERDLSIAPLVSAVAEEAARTQRKLGELIGLWQQVIPPELSRQTRITALRAGVLHVAVDSAADLYELDRILRAGGTEELRRRYRGTLVRVRLQLPAP